jgi:hypothetical protein
MQPTTILLEDKRGKVRDRFEAAQQFGAAVVLIMAGFGRLRSTVDAPSGFGVALIAAGALLAWAAMREMRGRGTGHPGLVNLLAGVALLTEWAIMVADHGRWFRPSLLMGLTSLGLGIFHRPLDAKRRSLRALRMDDEGLSFRLNRFTRFTLRWAELSWIGLEPAEIRFQHRGRRQDRVALRRLGNAPEVVAALSAAARDRGVELRGTQMPIDPARNQFAVPNRVVVRKQ